MPLSDLLAQPLATNPDWRALRDGERTWTYRQLDDVTDRLATALLAQGLHPGDRLGLFMPNCAELVFAYLACFKTGVVAVPLNYRYLAPQVDYALDHSGSAMLIAHADRLDDLRQSAVVPRLQKVFIAGGHAAEFRPFDPLLETPADPRALPKLDEDALALIMYTSGTTAKPKGAMHSHATVLAGLTNTQQVVPLGSQDVSLVALSIAHAAGLTSQVLATLHVGGIVVLLKKFEPAAFFDAFTHHRPKTFLEQLPAGLYELVRWAQGKAIDFSNLRLCIAGGDKVPLELHKAFRELTGVEITEVCGMTESLNYAINPPFGKKKIGSIGQPLPGTEIRVVDDADNDVPAGKVGEMIVRSKANTVGYWNNPEETARALRGGWLHTGDLGRSDADGYLWFVGRKKDIIIRGGSNVSPQEVEDVFYQHPAVASVGVVGVPDPVLGQRIQAYVALKPGSPATETELIDFAAKRIARYMVPERVVFVEAMPLNATGKVDRNQLRQRAAAPSC